MLPDYIFAFWSRHPNLLSFWGEGVLWNAALLHQSTLPWFRDSGGFFRLLPIPPSLGSGIVRVQHPFFHFVQFLCFRCFCRRHHLLRLLRPHCLCLHSRHCHRHIWIHHGIRRLWKTLFYLRRFLPDALLYFGKKLLISKLGFLFPVIVPDHCLYDNAGINLLLSVWRFLVIAL